MLCDEAARQVFGGNAVNDSAAGTTAQAHAAVTLTRALVLLVAKVAQGQFFWGGDLRMASPCLGALKGYVSFYCAVCGYGQVTKLHACAVLYCTVHCGSIGACVAALSLHVDGEPLPVPPALLCSCCGGCGYVSLLAH